MFSRSVLRQWTKVQSIRYLRRQSNYKIKLIEKQTEIPAKRSIVELDDKIKFDEINEYRWLRLIDSNDFVESNQKCKLKNETISKSNSIDILIENLQNSSDIELVLHTIRPYIGSLSADHLQVIHHQINRLLFRYHPNLIHDPKQYFENLKTITESSVFKELLDCTFEQNKNLSNQCLLALLKSLILINNQSTKDLIELIFTGLYSRVDDLDLDEIVDFLVLSSNLFSPDLLSNFNQAFLKKVREIILKHDFKKFDSVLIKKCFLAAILNNDQQIANHLISVLLSSDYQFNFKQSVDLLKALKETSFRLGDDQNSKLNELILKCLQAIHDKLTLEPSNFDACYYAAKMHIDNVNLNPKMKVFYDFRILDAISPLLIKNNTNVYLAHNIMTNYAYFNIFNEKLLEFVYNSSLNDEKFRKKRGISAFMTFAKFKFPFIDYERMIQLIFDHDFDQIHKILENSPKKSIHLLVALILNNINEEKILTILKQMNTKTEFFFVATTSNAYRRINLARVYFALFSAMEKNLKVQIDREFKNLLDKIASRYIRPKITNFMLCGDKLQENVFLSNDVQIYAIAIYDKSKEDLIALTNFKAYFYKVNRIPLNKNQKLIAFIASVPLQGDIRQCDRPSNMGLRMILNHYRIKTVEVSISDYMDLSIEDRTKYFERKALKDCKNVK